MVKLGVANSRMKDFYDLWVLAQRFEFESNTLAAAIHATFKTRRTTLPRSSPLALRAAFLNFKRSERSGERFCERAGLRQILP
jgi:hypothetical protein